MEIWYYEIGKFGGIQKMKKVKYVITKLKKNNRALKIVRKGFVMTMMFIVGGLAVYLYVPKKETISLYPFKLSDVYSLSCSTELGATLFPEINYETDLVKKVDGELFTDGSKITVEVEGDTLNFLTATAVEVGIIEPAKFVIIENNKDKLMAMYYEEGEGSKNSSIDTFILNKNTGFGVWTKSKTEFFANNMPDGQVYYLQCN